MFAYCGNNPVNRKDTSGQGWLAALKVVVVIVIIVVVVIVVAEIAKDAIINKQEGINPVEKELAKKDPIGAYKGNKAKEIANQYQQELYPNTCRKDANQANAFKHAMWNAVMTDMIGEERAKQFADAHEEPWLEKQPDLCAMDHYFNEIGRQIAIQNKGQGYDVFAQKIQEAIKENKEYVIAWDEGN